MAREVRRTEVEAKERGAVAAATSRSNWRRSMGESRRSRSRGEFIRREVMLEMRYDTARPTHDGPRGLRPDRVEALTEHLKVNLGCGHIQLSDHVNVDQRALPGRRRGRGGGRPTIRARHSRAAVRSPPPGALPARCSPPATAPLLARPPRTWWRADRRVPDTEAMLEEFAAGSRTFDDLAMVVMGGQEYEGDFHFAMLSRSSLRTPSGQLGSRRWRRVQPAGPTDCASRWK